MRILGVLSLFAASSRCTIITDPSQLTGLMFDYIIVGAGTAGLTVANRLSENLTLTVLVIEAGGSDAGLTEIEAPFLAPEATPRTAVDWNFTVVPQTGLNNRVFPLPVGRVLGGSSSVNYLVHQYGTNDDWNRMANTVGDQGWAWANMKQYVTKHEVMVAPLDKHNTTGQFIPSLHSTTGLLQVSLPGVNQTTDAPIVATTTQLKEFPFNNDTSGVSPSILGFGFIQSSISGGIRTTASTAYLTPVNSRRNLTVLINSTVRRLVQTGTINNGTVKQFRAVQFSSTLTSPVTTVTARKQVILSAGGINTPKILMLSGIGNSPDLQKVGIPVVINNPSVGANFMDSTFLPNFFTVSSFETTLDSDLRNQTGFTAALAKWTSTKTGVIANNIVNMLGYARLPPTASIFANVSDPASGPNSPHYEIIPTDFFLPIISPHPDTGNFMTIVTTLSSPTSRGTIKLNTTSPFDPPLIDPKYMTSAFDIFTMRESVRAVQRFITAPAWAQFNITPFPPMVPASATNATVDAYIKSTVSTIFHPSGSAAMSKAANGLGAGVVNPNLTVKGIAGVSIVDASVWPFAPSTHPQGAVYLLAERAADILKAAPPFPPGP